MMLHLQPASRPSSALVSGYHPHHHPHHHPHSLPQLRDFNWDWDASTARASQSEETDKDIDYKTQCVLLSPRLKMNEHSTHLPLIEPPTGPMPPPHPSGYTHSRQSSSGQPFYQAYYSARQNQSPLAKKEDSTDREASARRRASAGTNAIASHLQIPPSINNSKGSLLEFAAQMTCLFWFETSQTLQLTQDPRSSTTAPAPLTSDAMPSMGFRKWVTTVLSMTQVTPNVIILALLFIYRLKSMNPGVKGKIGSEFRLLTVALMLGNKFLDDNTYTNKTWAEVSGISVQEIHVMEVEFLSNMRYSLFVREEEWAEWHEKLRRFSIYYDTAAEASTRASISIYNRGPFLPPPPASERKSSPLAGIDSGSAASPLQLTVLPALPTIGSAMAPPMSFSTAEMDLLPPYNRKRSRDDSQQDHPVKRTFLYAVATPPSSVSTPSLRNDSNSPLPRLPLPNIPAAGQHGGQSLSSGQLPVPGGRAMASIFPGTGRWSQNGMQLPSLPPSQHFNHPASSGTNSPASGIRNRPSPYDPSTGTSSPTSYVFPHLQGTTLAGLSPSDLPFARNSPYKPMRGVQTLLVPPPSNSVYHAPEQVPWDQLRYQPLGQPKSEMKIGVLPHFPYDTGSTPHQM